MALARRTRSSCWTLRASCDWSDERRVGPVGTTSHGGTRCQRVLLPTQRVHGYTDESIMIEQRHQLRDPPRSVSRWSRTVRRRGRRPERYRCARYAGFGCRGYPPLSGRSCRGMSPTRSSTALIAAPGGRDRFAGVLDEVSASGATAFVRSPRRVSAGQIDCGASSIGVTGSPCIAEVASAQALHCCRHGPEQPTLPSYTRSRMTLQSLTVPLGDSRISATATAAL